MAIWSAPVSPHTIDTEVQRARRCGAAMPSQHSRLSLSRFPRRVPVSTGGALALTVPSSVLVRADEGIE